MRQYLAFFVSFVALAAPSPPQYAGCDVFPATAMWNTRVDNLPVHPNSATYINPLASVKLHLDMGQDTNMASGCYYGIPTNSFDGSQAWTPFQFASGAYCDESDCAIGAAHTFHQGCKSGGACLTGVQIPIPANPLIESGLTGGGDHHLLVVDTNVCGLWEIYSATPSPWTITDSLAFYDLRSNNLRPQSWTSSDAAGLPVLPFLLKQAEAQNGPITHGLRFTLQASQIRGPSSLWEWPATHNTGSGPAATTMMMGQVIRLKSSFVIPGTWSVQSQNIARGLQQYGMYLADIGSNGYIQGEPNAGWDDTIFNTGGTAQIQGITLGNFEVVDISSIKSSPGWSIDSAYRPPASNPTPPTAPAPQAPAPTGKPTNTPTKTPTKAPATTPTRFPTGAPTLPDPCIGVSCNSTGHGFCVAGACSCTGGYTGGSCTIVPNCPVNNGWASTTPGTVATHSCPPGQSGNDTRRCNTDGTWGVEVNTCNYPPNCTDKIQNQDETAVDCGGVCPACAQCPSINCGAHGVCIEATPPSCQCSGGYTGDRCQTPPDPCLVVNCGAHGTCITGTGICNCTGGYTGALCQSPPAQTCFDGVQNQNETGIDCGGPCATLCPMYSWEAGPWSNCTKSCAGGTQTRTVNCVSSPGVVVGVGFCASLHPVESIQACNPDPCPTYTWQAGTFGACTAPCGTGFQTRPVDCISSLGNVVVPEGPTTCTTATKPFSQQTCNTPACTVNHFESGNWTTCTRSCGGGTQTRTVLCRNPLDTTTYPDANCTDIKPATLQACNIFACTAYHWSPCDQWSTCSAACGGGDGMLGQQRRDVLCVDGAGNVVDPTLCDPATKPQDTVTICNTQKCSDFNWMVTSPGWGACVNGVRTRVFHCHDATGGNAQNSDCTAVLGPPGLTSIACMPNTCLVSDCPNVQIAGVFLSCTASDMGPKCSQQCASAVKSLAAAYPIPPYDADSLQLCIEAFGGLPNPGVGTVTLANLHRSGRLCSVTAAAPAVAASWTAIVLCVILAHW